MKKFNSSKIVTFVQDNYRNLAEICLREGMLEVQMVLIDCGLSSVQVDVADRGFSFNKPGPLDMRMDQRSRVSLKSLLEETPEVDLANIIYQYGQERHSRRIARSIKNKYLQGEIQNTLQLAEAIRRAVPPQYRYGKIHPATRTFQALRIKVNNEIESLEQAIEQGIQILDTGGVLAVISFHSLEDGVVKRSFRGYEKTGLGKILTKKPITPTDDEVEGNPRSRSARLRVFERVRQP
jgi:16S rRNA (cytosine1402-N4)-methyltransferase